MAHCQKIATRVLELIGKNKLIYKGKTLSVTVSMGTTVFSPSDTPDELIARADKALYNAKRNGKNRIETELLNGN